MVDATKPLLCPEFAPADDGTLNYELTFHYRQGDIEFETSGQHTPNHDQEYQGRSR